MSTRLGTGSWSPLSDDGGACRPVATSVANWLPVAVVDRCLCFREGWRYPTPTWGRRSGVGTAGPPPIRPSEGPPGMSNKISDAIDRLTPDPWREANDFTPEMKAAHEALLECSSDAEREAAIGVWLQRHQPCLFGRIAAKGGFLSYCFLTEDDLRRPDEIIRDKIQQARLRWTRAAYAGKTSGFIVLLLSDRIARALPDEATLQLATGLASLYLLEQVVPDHIHLDEAFLEIPGHERTTWRWNVGVNYFSAQGDGRWWHDHRMPGGIAFSANSVGHMVKSDIMARAMVAMEKELGFSSGEYSASKVDSLAKALDLAMRTINGASEAVSGKATRLVPEAEAGEAARATRCPYPLPQALADKTPCEYWGAYHTDYTVPSEYFLRDVARPDGLPEHTLDFTYLFHDSIDNPDQLTPGEGRRVRGEDRTGTGAHPVPNPKRSRMEPDSLDVRHCARLRRALELS